MTDTTIRPFTIEVGDDVLDDLRRRLRATRWADAEVVDDWSQGTPLAYLQEFCAYWADEYDWRAREAALNRFEQFTTTIDGLDPSSSIRVRIASLGNIDHLARLGHWCRRAVVWRYVHDCRRRRRWTGRIERRPLGWVRRRRGVLALPSSPAGITGTSDQRQPEQASQQRDHDQTLDHTRELGAVPGTAPNLDLSRVGVRRQPRRPATTLW